MKMGIKKKYFSKLVDCYFVKWASVDTWYTKHPDDMKRFYRFVVALKKFSKRKHSAKDLESRIRDAIVDYHNNFNRTELGKIAKELSVIATHCHGCLKTKINPIDDIEVYGLIDKERSLQLRLKYARLRKASVKEIRCLENESRVIKQNIDRLLKEMFNCGKRLNKKGEKDAIKTG